MQRIFSTLAVVLAGMLATSASAQDFKLSSSSIAEGKPLAPSFVYKGFGCEGGNQSPDLSWSGAPAGTQSFAVTAYDPDAPTGSGWWHWSVINLPASANSLPLAASGTDRMPKGAVEIHNDFGAAGFGGACPPPGEVHRYVFTVYALKTARLDLPENASNALAGFMIGANTIAKGHITALYHR